MASKRAAVWNKESSSSVEEKVEETCAISSEIVFKALSGSAGGVAEMTEDDEPVVSTLVVELDPETSSPRNLITPRLSDGTPPDGSGTTEPG